MAVSKPETSKNYWLAATLPLPIQQNSRRRHIQRFLSLTRLSVVLVWFPLIKKIVSQRIPKGKRLIIALDRTAWQNNNILMASAIYQKRAFPIFWILLSKKGASDLREQQVVLRPVIKLFKTHLHSDCRRQRVSQCKLGAVDRPSRCQVRVEAKKGYDFSPD